MLTSFVPQRLYETSFGDILGKPDFVRRPKLPDAVSLGYLMPRRREGDIDLIISLADQRFWGFTNRHKVAKICEVSWVRV